MSELRVDLNVPIEVTEEDRLRLHRAAWSMLEHARSSTPGWLAGYMRSHKEALRTMVEILRRTTATPDVPRADDH